MADESDVETALVALLVAAFYPSGTTSPSAITGSPTISIDRGWPTEADVRKAVNGGIQLVRVHAIPGMSRNASRYEWQWISQTPATPTLTVTFAANVLTISGTVTAGEIVGVISAGEPYTYTVLATDTPDSIAEALAALVPGATASGATVSLPATGMLPSAAVGVPTEATMEVGRQAQVFSISVWATTVPYRDAMFRLLMPAITQTLRMTMPDGSIATFKGIQSSGPNDLPARAGTWARDARVTWEYAIQISMIGPPTMGFQATFAPPNAAAPTLTSTSPV